MTRIMIITGLLVAIAARVAIDQIALPNATLA
jgi:hypothetical protein